MPLPPWDPSMCDGCNVPWFARDWVSADDPKIRSACCRHDERYYYGGTSADRRRADAYLYNDLVEAGEPVPIAWLMWAHVRLYGSIYWPTNTKKWAWGGKRYSYD